MKKIISFMLFLLMVATPWLTWAQDSNTLMVVMCADGSKLTIPVSEVDSITFDEAQQGCVLEAVDLGLSVKWANVNLDVTQADKVATAPEAFGSLQGWADPTGLKTDKDANKYPGYDRPMSIGGGEYDIATQQMGDGWRLPTSAECEELLSLDWERTTLNDVPGIKFTAKNGNSIFLPYAGYRLEQNVFQQGQYGYYWTSDRNAVLNNFAVDLNIGVDICKIANNIIYNGCSVRAVKK